MYTLGIDIGSTTSKCIILENGKSIVAKSLEIGGTGTSGLEDALSTLWKKSGLTIENIGIQIATGYGRNSFKPADERVSELKCHALGGKFLFSNVCTIIDVGGQDAKVISLNSKGRMCNFIMNDKCAAGTGRFLDVMASVLRMKTEELGKCALKATDPAAISSTCTVFAESEVISQMAIGVSRENLVAGICNSVVARTAAFARRAGITEQVCMSGGVAQNQAIRKGLGINLGTEILYSPLSQYCGAIGAALYGWEQIKQ